MGREKMFNLVDKQEAVAAVKWPSGYTRTPHFKSHNISVKWKSLTSTGCSETI